jgi:hypothetical protein
MFGGNLWQATLGIMDGRLTLTLLLADNGEEQAEAQWSFSGDEGRLDIDSPSFGALSGSGHDLLAALAEVRRVIEEAGARVLCNGSRVDATASGMLSQWGGARMVYLLDGVPRGERPPTAFIFDAAPRQKVGTLDEQAEYHKSYFSR